MFPYSDMQHIVLTEPITEKDGRPRYASTSKFILRDDNGEFIGLVGVSKDITMEYYLQRNRVRELEYLFTLPHDVYFAAYMDIDDWRIVSEHHQSVNGFDFAYHGSIDTLVMNAYTRMADSSVPAAPRLGARKNTHARFTKAKVSSQRRDFGRRSRRLPQKRSTIWARPWRPPQRMNVQPAPCQKPLTRNTIRMFR